MQTTENISMTRRVSRATAEACSTAARASRNAVNRGVSYVRRNPVKVILGAVGVGVLIALALHRREATWRERAFTLPVKKLKNLMSSATDLASSATARTGEMLGACTERTSELAGDAMTAVKKTARGLRFWS